MKANGLVVLARAVVAVLCGVLLDQLGRGGTRSVYSTTDAPFQCLQCDQAYSSGSSSGVPAGRSPSTIQ